ISQLPIVDKNEIIGSISENMVLNFIIENPLNNPEKAAHTIMTEAMPIVSMETPLSILNKYFSEKIPGVVVKDQVGNFHVLTKYDIIRAL
ncbi:MAG: cystathionine beta-synthase, partial [Saprospiraceae bacterium]